MSITFGETFTSSEQCTSQLRFVLIQRARPEVGKKLQQAWEITRYGSDGAPFERLVEWRDVPTDWD